MWRATPTPSIPTAPPPEPCGATASPRPCGPGRAISTTWQRPWAGTRRNTAGRWSCPRDTGTISARTKTTMTPSVRSWTRAWRQSATSKSGRRTGTRPGLSAGAWAWRCSGTTPACGPSPWSPAPAGWSSTRTAPSRSRPGRRRSARAATPPSARWPPTPSASPSPTYISSLPRTPMSPPSAPGPMPPGRRISAASPSGRPGSCSVIESSPMPWS